MSSEQDFHENKAIYEEYEVDPQTQTQDQTQPEGETDQTQFDQTQSHDENQPAAPNTSVYVENLPRDVTELELRQIFSNFGFIDHVKIARKPNYQILGYAFIHFKTIEDATKAVAGLNNYQLRDKNIRVRFAQPRKNPEEKKPPQKSNLYIAGIPENFTNEMLQQHFQSFGTITKVNILIDNVTNRSKGVGFVVFETQEQAEAAIAAMNGQPLVEGGQPLIVKHAQDDRDRQMRGNYPPAGPGGYGPQRRQGIHSQNRFNPMGPPRGSYGPRGGNYPSRQPYQQHYGSYQQPPQSYGGYQGYDQGYQPQARGYYQQSNYQQSNSYRQGPQQNGTTLFVFHIPSVCTESDLSGLFGLYGTVSHVHIPRESHGGNKGYAFVTMAHAKDADNAIQYLNGYQMGDKYLKVSLKGQNQQQHQSSASSYGSGSSQPYYGQPQQRY